MVSQFESVSRCLTGKESTEVGEGEEWREETHQSQNSRP